MRISEKFKKIVSGGDPACYIEPTVLFEDGDLVAGIFAPSLRGFHVVAYFEPEEKVLCDESFDTMGEAVDRFSGFLKTEYPDDKD